MLENKYHKSKKTTVIYICSKTCKFEIAYKLPQSLQALFSTRLRMNSDCSGDHFLEYKHS